MSRFFNLIPHHPIVGTCVTLLLAINGSAALAADGNGALYDAQAPADAAFIRVLNLDNTAADVLVSGKSASQKISAGQLGGYLFVDAGAHQVTVNSATTQLDVGKSSAKTLIFNHNGLTSLDDTYSDDSKKALVAFYNLTQQPLTLKTLDGKHAIVADIGPMSNGARKVNELKIAFAAYQGDQQIAVFDETFLKKGRSYSFLAIETQGQVKALSVANSVDSIE
ncbi:MAG: alginate O-acetyltransferase AlgF [Hahellaceae bacterium]|nr:alginate O-acetyltransferase AlgF [Hahellaceae bacterium]MCP5169119.1 alginate O-acetyltransferase AlgF [Hahellaceae bacterium]